jgi:NIMA (never in mitosis gene a)-related kinase
LKLIIPPYNSKILFQVHSLIILILFFRIIDKEHKKIYIIMEHCAGGDMTKLIKKCKIEKDSISEEVIWKIFTQIILALNECHNRKEGKILH